jgi:hypothetical protein
MSTRKGDYQRERALIVDSPLLGTGDDLSNQTFQDRDDFIRHWHGTDLGCNLTRPVTEATLIQKLAGAAPNRFGAEPGRLQGEAEPSTDDCGRIDELVGSLRDSELRQACIDRAQHGSGAAVTDDQIATRKEQ